MWRESQTEEMTPQAFSSLDVEAVVSGVRAGGHGAGTRRTGGETLGMHARLPLALEHWRSPERARRGAHHDRQRANLYFPVPRGKILLGTSSDIVKVCRNQGSNAHGSQGSRRPCFSKG